MSFTPRPFGPFILLDKIAVGGMAELYLARLPGVGGFEKLLAIKKILPNFNANKEFVSMFIEEAKLTVQLTHANIVHVYDFGDINGELYLAMEFVEGNNIRQILGKLEQEKQLCPIEIACYIAAEICRGIDYAHNREDKKHHKPLNLIHRDISPQNIIVSYDGEVKIIDFGIAKAASKVEQTRAGVLKGKFGYMSPEQSLGESVDNRTDIFSAGIILFELLTRERLFISDSEVETIKKIQKAKIPPPSRYNPAIPKELEEIVLKALARERGERYQTARDFQRALSHFIYATNPHFVPHDLADFLTKLFEKEYSVWKERVREVQKIASELSEKLIQPKIPAKISPSAPTENAQTKIPPTQPPRLKPTIKRSVRVEPSIVKIEKSTARETTKVEQQREDTEIKPAVLKKPKPQAKQKIELFNKSFAQRAITLFIVFILGIILVYAIVLFIEGPSPERKISSKIKSEVDKEKNKPVETKKNEPAQDIKPEIKPEPVPETKPEPVQEIKLETIPDTKPEAKPDVEPYPQEQVEPPLKIVPSPAPQSKSPIIRRLKSKVVSVRKPLTKKLSKKNTPIPLSTLLPNEVEKNGFLVSKLPPGNLYIDEKLAPILLDPIELKPGTYHLLFVDHALEISGEKDIVIQAGKTIEIKRGDFTLKPIEKAER